MPTPEGLQPATGTPIHSLHLSADSQYEYRRQQRQHPKKIQCAGDNGDAQGVRVQTKTKRAHGLSLIHISEPTRRTPISYAVFCLKKKKKKNNKKKIIQE